jgi:hypothetical protein
MVSHMVFMTKLGFENLKNLVTSTPLETKKFRGLHDDFSLKRPNHHLGPEYVHLFRNKRTVYGETFLRNFKFYAKTLTKLHDLTVLNSPFYGYFSSFVRRKSQSRNNNPEVRKRNDMLRRFVPA